MKKHQQAQQDQEIFCELFRISMVEKLAAHQNGNEFEANWDEVKWGDCLKIGNAVGKLVAEKLEIDSEQISHKLVHVIEQGFSQPCVTFGVISGEVEIEMKRKETEAIVQNFVDSIFCANEKNHDLFDDNILNEQEGFIVKKHAAEFLEKNGGGRLTTSVEVKAHGITKTCSGSFSPRPSISPEAESAPKCFYGKTVLIDVEKSEFGIRDNQNKAIRIAYNPNLFFRDLKDLLGEPIQAKFKAREAKDARGKYFFVLEEITEMLSIQDLLG